MGGPWSKTTGILMKRRLGHTQERTRWRQKEKTVIYKPRKKPQNEINPAKPCSWTSSLQNCEEIHFCCLGLLSMAFCYGRPSRLIYACCIALPRGANKALKKQKTKRNPSIPKLSGLVWKAIQKSASFNSIQPRLLILEKSSQCFVPLLHWEEEGKRKRKEKNVNSYAPLCCGFIMRWFHQPVTSMVSRQNRSPRKPCL